MDWLKLATQALGTVKEIVTELQRVNASLNEVKANQKEQITLLQDIKRRQAVT